MLKISCKISVLLDLFLVVVPNKSIMQYITSHHHLVTHHQHTIITITRYLITQQMKCYVNILLCL